MAHRSSPPKVSLLNRRRPAFDPGQVEGALWLLEGRRWRLDPLQVEGVVIPARDEMNHTVTRLLPRKVPLRLGTGAAHGKLGAVAVGGTAVAVGGTDVAVGGSGVAVGVGGIGVAVGVGGTGVGVGGTGVGVGAIGNAGNVNVKPSWMPGPPRNNAVSSA